MLGNPDPCGGGGSVCDYAKAVSVSAYCTEDPWEKYYLQMKDVGNEIKYRS